MARNLASSTNPLSQATPEQPSTGTQRTEGVPTPLPTGIRGNERSEQLATPTPSSTPFNNPATETQLVSETQQAIEVDSSSNPSISFPTTQLATLILGMSIAIYLTMLGARFIASKLKIQLAV